MTLAVGTETYNVDAKPVIARGITYTHAEVDAALDGPVREVVEDLNGRERALAALASVSLTEFEKKNLEKILGVEPDLENWEVGEAIAETYLTHHKVCQFPWPDKWDERKSRSSLPGADLVGLQETGQVDCPFRLAFGEVKTSEDKDYPPNVMYGRHGLKNQLEDLRDNQAIRDKLFRYLALRAAQSTWQTQYQSAAKRYLTDATDVAIFGILIRDVEPHENDLRRRSDTLARRLPQGMTAELLAVYLPVNSIATLARYYQPGKGGQRC